MQERQIKLVYAALYLGLGVIDSARTREIEALITQPAGSGHSDVSSEGTTKKSRLPSLAKAISAFTCAIDPMPKSRALERWRQMTRDSSDKMVVRYIAQFDDTLQAVQSIGEAIKWHDKHRPFKLLRRGEGYYAHDEAYINQYKEGKAMIIGRDRLGRPVVLIRTRLHRPSAQSKEAGQRLVVNMLTLAYMYQSEQHDGVTVIFDMTGWTMANMDNSLVLFIIQAANKCYPGIAGTIFVHNAPKIFAAVWRMIKMWLSPSVTGRILFTHRRNDLLALVPIDNLPSDMGGMASDKGGWTDPDPRDDALMADRATKYKLKQERLAICVEFESHTRAWLLGEANQADRLRLSARQRENFWALEPYTRRRTIFDRQGLLDGPQIVKQSQSLQSHGQSLKSSSPSTQSPGTQSPSQSTQSSQTRRQAIHFDVALAVGAP